MCCSLFNIPPFRCFLVCLCNFFIKSAVLPSSQYVVASHAEKNLFQAAPHILNSLGSAEVPICETYKVVMQRVIKRNEKGTSPTSASGDKLNLSGSYGTNLNLPNQGLETKSTDEVAADSAKSSDASDHLSSMNSLYSPSFVKSTSELPAPDISWRVFRKRIGPAILNPGWRDVRRGYPYLEKEVADEEIDTSVDNLVLIVHGIGEKVCRFVWGAANLEICGE
jgi:hypothetical protein